MQPESLVADDVAAKRLVLILQNHESAPRAMYIIYHADRRPTPKLKSFSTSYRSDSASELRDDGRLLHHQVVRDVTRERVRIELASAKTDIAVGSH
jgi:hypothetical protein